jgi:cell wall-associated NlpC family hydrolase
MTAPPPVVVKVRTHPEDIKRATKERTPPLPFDAHWHPPSLQGIESLLVRGEKFASMIGPRIVRADLSQTLDEPLTIKLDIWDKARELLQSGLLDDKLRVVLGDTAFLMTRVAKSGDLLTIEFEDADVNKLRDFTAPLKVARGTLSRIGFVKKLLDEKGAPKLRWYIDAGSPGSVTVEKNPLALEPVKERKPGPFASTQVKNQQADADQLDNIKVVLGHLFELGATKDELIMTSMCCTQESTWRNSKAHTDHDSEGLFQQRASVSTWDGGGVNREKAAELFWTQLKKAEAAAPGLEKTLLIAAVQHPAPKYNRAYEQWQAESTKTVGAWERAFGGSQSAVATSLYEFRRGGLDGTVENTWECLGRLADEVQYRRFIVEGVFYFLPDELLVGTGPRLLLRETSSGMLGPIDFDMDEGVDPQTCTFSIHTEQWFAPVGTCIEIADCGPANGIWLVNKVAGNLLIPHEQDIELVRPRAVLTEPPNDETVDLATESGGGRAPATGQNQVSDKLLPGTEIQQSIVDDARSWLGVPYRYGGTSRAGVDCSGFTQQVYISNGINISRVSNQQFSNFPVKSNKSLLLAGDQVFFNWPPEVPPGHTGIYIGGGEFIHAPHTGDSVKISRLDDYLASGAQWYGFSRPWAPEQLA